MVWFRWFSEIPGLCSQVPAVHLPGIKKGALSCPSGRFNRTKPLLHVLADLFFFESRPLVCSPPTKRNAYIVCGTLLAPLRGCCQISCIIWILEERFTHLDEHMLQYVAIGYIIVGFLREWCSRAGGNWGTLWSLWGTSGKIRGITTPPPFKNPITSDLPWLDGREADEAGRTIRFEIPDVSWSRKNLSKREGDTDTQGQLKFLSRWWF